MTYPVLPMAIVTFLAAVSEERAGLDPKVRNVTVMAHHDKTVRSLRFAIAEDANWGEMVERSVRLATEGEVDTMTVIYPADGDDPVDFGIILEAGRPPSFFQWTYAPRFDIRLAPENVERQISQGVGVETLQGGLDASKRGARPAVVPFVNPGYQFGKRS